MISALFSRLCAHLGSILPRRPDQLTIALAAAFALGIMSLVHFSSAETITQLPPAPAFVINPNTVTQAELLLLPRVGPSLAKAIMTERAKAPFETAEDISRTPGIGDKTLAKLLPHLKVNPQP